jgi:murein DD-endopeptidase MepM/ murein hydrolase activator NlpD
VSSVFLSYSRKNLRYVRRLVTDLEAAGVDIWWDQTEITTGEKWDIEIERGMSAASHFLLVMSEDAVQSPNVRDEINLALDLNRIIVPIRIDNCRPPLRVARFQYIDFADTRAYRDNVNKLLQYLPRQNASYPPRELGLRAGDTLAKPPTRTESPSGTVARNLIAVVLLVILVLGGGAFVLLNAQQNPTSTVSGQTQVAQVATEEAAATEQIIETEAPTDEPTQEASAEAVIATAFPFEPGLPLHSPLRTVLPISVAYNEGLSLRSTEIPAPEGTPVLASAPGVVARRWDCTKCTPEKPNFVAAGLRPYEPNALNDLRWGYGYGNVVIVQYAWDVLPDTLKQRLAQLGYRNAFVYVYYGQLSRIDVQVGQAVDQNTVLGAVGRTGNIVEPTLRLEIRYSRNENAQVLPRRSTVDPALMFDLGADF